LTTTVATKGLDDLSFALHAWGHGATDSRYTVYCNDLVGDEDVVFLEFAVNDLEKQRTDYLEGLIRNILATPKRPQIILIMFMMSHAPQYPSLQKQQVRSATPCHVISCFCCCKRT
jgi:hypothetical protein